MNPTPATHLYSGIRASHKRIVLRQGSLLAGIGILCWVISGALLPLSVLTSWGILIFGLGSALIAVGLVPYRRLVYLENHPHRLTLVCGEGIHFAHQGSPPLTIPWPHIEQLSYHDDPTAYGITVTLRNKRTVFFPFFGKHAFKTLQDLQNLEHPLASPRISQSNEDQDSPKDLNCNSPGQRPGWS